MADTASQACRGQAQQFIAGVVPEVVVDCFKTIEVNHENGKHLSAALGTGERLFQAVLGDITVRQASECIVPGVKDQSLVHVPVIAG